MSRKLSCPGCNKMLKLDQNQTEGSCNNCRTQFRLVTDHPFNPMPFLEKVKNK